MNGNEAVKKMAGCLLCFFLVLAGTVLAEPGRANQLSLDIAVVDMREVEKGSEGWAQFEQEVRRRRARVEEVLMEYDSRRSSLEMEYESLPPATDRAHEKRQELEALVEEFELTQRELTREFESFIVEGHREFIGRLKDVIAQYAAENDIDLVLKKQRVDFSVPEMEELMVREELEAFAMADVLYAAPGLDISSEIVRRLNERTEQRGADEE